MVVVACRFLLEWRRDVWVCFAGMWADGVRSQGMKRSDICLKIAYYKFRCFLQRFSLQFDNIWGIARGRRGGAGSIPSVLPIAPLTTITNNNAQAESGLGVIFSEIQQFTNSEAHLIPNGSVPGIFLSRAQRFLLPAVVALCAHCMNEMTNHARLCTTHHALHPHQLHHRVKRIALFGRNRQHQIIAVAFCLDC